METEHHGKLGQNKRGQRLTKLSIKPRRKQMNQGNDKPCDCYVGLKSSTPKNPRFPLILELEQFRNNLRCVLLIFTTNFTSATLPSKPQLIDEYLGTAGVVSVEISSSAHCCLQRPFRGCCGFSSSKISVSTDPLPTACTAKRIGRTPRLSWTFLSQCTS